MNMEEEYQYETTIDRIIDQLEQLINDILLAAIKRIADEHRETTLKSRQDQEDF